MVKTSEKMREAMFYLKKEGNVTQCVLCPQYCRREEGQNGFCRVRLNRDGVIYALNYGEVSSYGMDPIEKKPLYHFYPGSFILSLGTVGCNLKCGFCQNWQIAHGDPQTESMTPEEAVAMASRQVNGQTSIGLAYTYSEPFMWYEFVYDTARLAREKGLKNVLVTNGYINEEPLREILPFIDAMNIDVKGFTEGYYKGTCRGRLEPVLKTVEIAHEKCHVELTTLLVTGLNDKPEEIEELVKWVAGLNPAIPLHFSRYYPSYEMDLPPTPPEKMYKARDIARRYLDYVYLGNLWGESNNTLCPRCGEPLVDRSGYSAEVTGVEDGKCRKCGKEINIADN